MAQSVNPAPPTDEIHPTPAQVKKARMLVSMLGADFAKTSRHPFFRELAQTAVRPLEQAATVPDLSAALAKLVRRLGDAKAPQRPAERIEVAHQAEDRHDPARRQDARGDIMAQHPALIAKHLVTLPTSAQLETLRKLRGPTARQVAAYVAEMKT
ncbi:hypothetical protein [Litoreibacter albidus]|uniref:hypothetical protein n=1 Tax=Litoreibacter albidus TaxID=670155 RepID=UPI003736EE69